MVVRFAPIVCALAACGRLEFGGRSPDGSIVDDATPVDGAGDTAAPDFVVLPGAGIWNGASSLRRTLTMSTSRRAFTFATWYRSAQTNAMILNAGIDADSQSFIWAGFTNGTPMFQHQDGGFQDAIPAESWTRANQWVHVVVAVDTTLATPAQRTRIYFDGVEQTLLVGGQSIGQDLDLFLGNVVEHSIGRKFDSTFPWTGELADTYLIWGHQLSPASFVAPFAPGELRSIAYAGPVTAESAHFTYEGVNPGTNAFAGQPTWTADGVGLQIGDLPY